MSSAPAPSKAPVWRAILDDAVDYAGLFPPASLDMVGAVANYASYRTSDDAWALGRFVVPVGRLDEFLSVAGPFLPEADDASSDPWRLSVLASADSSSDNGLIEAFHRACAGRAVIDSVEVRALSVVEIEHSASLQGPDRRLFVELPLTGDVRPMLQAVRRIGAFAKMRMGGVTAEAVPPVNDVAAFLAMSVEEQVVLKATAGLHHALRAEYPMTYAAGAPIGTMFGFVNVVMAAALARLGAGEEELAQVLDERDPQAFHPRSGGLQWRERIVSLAELKAARSLQLVGFGSCSFREPLDELAALAAEHAGA
jgi:hypothetical protein